MPGRVSTRNSTSTRAPRKSAAPTGSSRTSAASRVSGPVTRILEETPENALRTKVCTIFSDAQKSTTAHRKLAASLRKIQEACCYEPPKGASKSAGDFEEEDFNAEMVRCVKRVLPVRKAEPAGDRVVGSCF